MRLETLHHLPALAHNIDDSISRSEEQAVGTRAHARYVAALEGVRGVVVREGDLGDFEEVKRLPLKAGVSERWKVGDKTLSRRSDVPRWPCCRIGEVWWLVEEWAGDEAR